MGILLADRDTNIRRIEEPEGVFSDEVMLALFNSDVRINILLHMFFVTVSVREPTGFVFRRQLEDHIHQPGAPQVWISFSVGIATSGN